MRKSEPDKHEPVSRLLIIDDANRCVYGRGLLERIALGRDKGKVHKVVGISAEALIVYLAHDWPDVPECREALWLLSQGQINHDLMAVISEKVQVTYDDLEQIRELHFRGMTRKQDPSP